MNKILTISLIIVSLGLVSGFDVLGSGNEIHLNIPIVDMKGRIGKCEVEVLDVQVGNWDQAQGLTITETWLTNFPQIDGIAAANDGMALGAVEAADEAGRLDEIIIVAVDATQEALVSISEGRQYGTVLQDPVGAALLVYQVAEQILAGEEPEFVNLLPAPQISPDNVDEYLN